MKRGVTIAMLILVPILIAAQDIIYGKCDSVAIERILQKHFWNAHKESGKHILAIAEEFIGCKYVPNTLDGHNGEPLYISCTRLDCTTFVELVTAIALSTKEASPSFATVCRNLERLRYRDGRREGYASRLHYTSWWIADNTCKGIVKEVTTGTSHKFWRLNMDFMSTHPESYAMLSNDTAMLARIAMLEKPFRGIDVPYIPKDRLNEGKKCINVKDGDIIALVTTIDGLDVSHVGFAFWTDDRLHLLHASSGKGEVIKDPVTLFDYQKNKSKQCGIRVIRIED